MTVASPPPVYVVAARRTALGRIGGLHQSRRLEELAAPVVEAVLSDCGLASERVDQLILGNASAGGNPARLVALAAGLDDATSALTVDRQCGSGLDAILLAIRNIAAGDANVIVAGGAESLSTAPWRIAKPRNLYQLPHFIGLDPTGSSPDDEPQPFEASEHLARRLGITRAQQDAWAVRSHAKAQIARERRLLVGEIVPLRSNAEEKKDQSAIDPSLSDLEKLRPFAPPDGTLTPGNTSALHDGAAMVVAVSESIWDELGRPSALRLVASASQGVSADDEASAPLAAMRKLYGRLNGFDRSDLRVVEMGEASAAQAIAFADGLGIDADIVNPAGGALVRGHPLGAAGAVLVVRLFTDLVRAPQEAVRFGAVAQGTIGGLGLAALFEAVVTP